MTGDIHTFTQRDTHMGGGGLVLPAGLVLRWDDYVPRSDERGRRRESGPGMLGYSCSSSSSSSSSRLAGQEYRVDVLGRRERERERERRGFQLLQGRPDMMI
jgi:hypothetical protein